MSSDAPVQPTVTDLLQAKDSQLRGAMDALSQAQAMILALQRRVAELTEQIAKPAVSPIDLANERAARSGTPE
jgi:hypothetical protein